MTKYRIKEIRNEAGEVTFIPQRKKWWGWSSFKYGDGYITWPQQFSTLEKAQAAINEYIEQMVYEYNRKMERITYIKYNQYDDK